MLCFFTYFSTCANSDSNQPSEPTKILNDAPPSPNLIKHFFAQHKGKVFLIGSIAVLVGLALVGLNVLSLGATLPLTLPLSIALISFGVTTIAVACLAGYWTGSAAGEANGPEADQARKKIKPPGHRASSGYLTRQIRPQVKVANK